MLEWVDKAAYACAVGWSSGYCVTAYVGNVHFSKPILAGHLVEVRARVVRTGRSSMTILSDVHAVDVRTGERWETCRCAMVFVGTDKEGKPVPVPTFEPSTAEEFIAAAGAGRQVSRQQLTDEQVEELSQAAVAS